MSRIILQKVGTTLVATDEESVAALARIKDGTEVYAEVMRARNLRQHRLFFALAHLVAEAMDTDIDVVRKEALIRTGHANVWMDPISGAIRIEAKSMKIVEGMSQEEFDAFMDKAVNLMAGWIGSEHKDLLRRYNELAADKRYEGMRRG